MLFLAENSTYFQWLSWIFFRFTMFIVSWVATQYSSAVVHWRFGIDNDFLCNASQLMRSFAVSVSWRIKRFDWWGESRSNGGKPHAFHHVAPKSARLTTRSFLPAALRRKALNMGLTLSPIKAKGIEFLARNCMQFPRSDCRVMTRFIFRCWTLLTSLRYTSRKCKRLRGEPEGTKTVWIEL